MHWVPVSRTDTYQKPWYTVYDNIGCNAESFKSNRPGLQKKPTKCWRINTKRISQKTGKLYGVHTRWPMTMPLLNQKIKGSGSQQLYPTNIFWVWRAKKIGPESSPNYYLLLFISTEKMSKTYAAMYGHYRGKKEYPTKVTLQCF